MSNTYGWLPLLYLAGGIFWTWFGWHLSGRDLRRKFFDPVVLFCLSFAFFYFFSPSLALYEERHWHVEEYPIEVPFESFAWFMVFGLVTVGVYHALGGSKRFVEARTRLLEFANWETYDTKTLRTLLIFLLIPAFYALYIQVSLIVEHGIQGYLTNRTTLQAGGQLFVAPLNLFAGAMLIYFVNQLVRSSIGLAKVSGPVLISIMMAAIFAGAVQGSRSRTLIAVLLLILTVAILQTNRESMKRAVLFLAPGFIAVFAAAILLQQLRFVLVKGQDIGGTVESDAFVGNAVESLREYENNWWLIQHEHEFEKPMGLTFVAAATSFFPRSLWPDKPTGGGPFIRNLIRPGTYNFNSGLPLTSYTTGMPAEGFMNFGRIGFLVSGVLMGLLLTFMTYCLKFARSTIPFCVWLGLLYRGIEFQRSEVLGGVANTVFFCAPLLFAYWVTSWLTRPSTGKLASEG